MSKNKINPLGIVMMLEYLIDEVMEGIVSKPVCLEDHLLLSHDVPKGLEPPPIHSDDKGVIYRCVEGKGWQVHCRDCERFSCWLNSYHLAELWDQWHTYLIEQTISVHESASSV